MRIRIMRKKEFSSHPEKAGNHLQDSCAFPKKQIPKPVEIIHRTKNNTEKQIIIDLDDAYGVPFSSASFYIQEK